MGNICNSKQEDDTPLDDMPAPTRRKGMGTTDEADGYIYIKEEGAIPLEDMPVTTRKKGMITKDRTEEPSKKKQKNLSKMSEASKANVRLKNELTENTIEIKDIKEELASARKENKDITDRCSASEALSQRDAEISTLKRQLVDLNDEKDVLLTRLKKNLTLKHATEISNIKSELASARKENKDITNRSSEALSQRDAQISTLKSQLVTLNDEKDALLTRLSSLAGARLLDITDLNDSNRPTKLAEQYSELYDNEWTDAFSALEEDGLSENQCIEMLLNMLITSYRTCKEKADSQIRGFHNAVSEFMKDDPLPYGMSKHLKDSRKKNYKEFVQQLTPSVKKKLIKLKLMTEHRLRMTDTFLEKSLTICWLMCIQDPPVYIDCNVHIRGQNFQKSSYKEYTKSGPIVDFVVWPVVYLQKDGAMLCKGTVQCTASKDDLPSIEGNKSVKGSKYSQSLHVSTSKTSGVLQTTDKRHAVSGQPPQIFNTSGLKNKRSNQVVRQSAPVNPTITPTSEGTGKSREFNAKGDNRNGLNGEEEKYKPDLDSAEQSDADARTKTKKTSTIMYVKHGDGEVKTPTWKVRNILLQ